MVEARHFPAHTVTKASSFSGSQPAMLDLMIWPWFERIPPYLSNVDAVPKDKFPKVTAWIENMWQTKAVKATCEYSLERKINVLAFT